MMKAAASFSNLSCSFIDALSLSGNDTPAYIKQEACCNVFWQIWLCVYMSGCVVSLCTWREDTWVESHLKDDVTNRAHLFTSSSYCTSGSRVTCKYKKKYLANIDAQIVFVKHLLSFIHAIYTVYINYNMQKSCCVWQRHNFNLSWDYNSSVLVQCFGYLNQHWIVMYSTI